MWSWLLPPGAPRQGKHAVGRGCHCGGRRTRRHRSSRADGSLQMSQQVQPGFGICDPQPHVWSVQYTLSEHTCHRLIVLVTRAKQAGGGVHSTRLHLRRSHVGDPDGRRDAPSRGRPSMIRPPFTALRPSPCFLIPRVSHSDRGAHIHGVPTA